MENHEQASPCDCKVIIVMTHCSDCANDVVSCNFVSFTKCQDLLHVLLYFTPMLYFYLKIKKNKICNTFIKHVSIKVMFYIIIHVDVS